MKLRSHNLVLLTLLTLGGLSLVAWWGIQIQTLKTTTWKSLPPDLPALTTSPPASEAGNQSVERPLFWESRRPQPKQAKDTSDKHTAQLELLGIVTESNQRIALIRPQQGTPPLLVRRLQQGESYNGITVINISNSSVTIVGNQGQQILTLKRSGQDTSQQPAKLSAPQTIETTRSQRPDDPRKHTDEAEKNAPAQTQPPPQ